MLDLEEGVLTIFVEAQAGFSLVPELAADLSRTAPVDLGAGRLRTDNRLAMDFHKKEVERRQASDVRAIRASQKRAADAYVRSHACRVEQAKCPKCGGDVERREGNARWVHLATPRGACVPPEPKTSVALRTVAPVVAAMKTPYWCWHCRRRDHPLGACLEKRALRRITIAGRTRTAAEWASERGITKTELVERLRRGWSLIEAITSTALRLTG